MSITDPKMPPERFELSDRPGHDIHWTLAAELVKVVWRKHNATFAAAVKEFYGAPDKREAEPVMANGQQDWQP